MTRATSHATHLPRVSAADSCEQSEQANKYPTTNGRRHIFDGILDGSIVTLAQLQQPAKANSVPSQIGFEGAFTMGDANKHFDYLLNYQDQGITDSRSLPTLTSS